MRTYSSCLLDFGLDIVKGVTGLNIKRNGLAAGTQHQLQGALLLDVVVQQRAAILGLLAGKGQMLPVMLG